MGFFSVFSPTSHRSLGLSSPNLMGRWRAAPDISLRGSFFKGQGHRGQRSKLWVFSVCSSQVLWPIFTKLGGKVEGGPGYFLEGFIFFKRSRSSRSRVKFMFFFLFVPLLLPSPWAYLHQTWWEGGGRPPILTRGVHFLKVKVIKVKGQISVSRQSLVRFA